MGTNNDSTGLGSLKHSLHTLFLNHPESVGESYFEHQRAAMTFAGSLTVTAAAALIHAMVPGLCQHTARNRIELLNKQLQDRSAVAGNEKTVG